MKYALAIIALFLGLQALADDSGAAATTQVATESAAPVTVQPEADSKIEKKAETAVESEIPLNLEAAKASKSDENPWIKLLLTVSVVGTLATAGYIYLKKSGYRNTTLKANQIKVLTQFHLGPKKSLAIIRVAGESVLIGVTDQNISLIKTLSLLDEEIPETTPAQFNQLMDRNPEAEFQLNSKIDDEEDFAMTGIKNIVSKKIKNMRSI